MTAHELAKKLLILPDTELIGQVTVELSKETLAHMSYPFPCDFVVGELELGDTSYSDNTTVISVNVAEEDLVYKRE